MLTHHTARAGAHFIATRQGSYRDAMNNFAVTQQIWTADVRRGRLSQRRLAPLRIGSYHGQ